MLGERLRQLRQASGLVQRQVAAELHVDTAYVSKMEHNEKPVSRIHLTKMAKLYNCPENELLPIWLADKLLQLATDENLTIQALELALASLKENKIHVL